MLRIFISYKRVDLDKVLKIKDQIESVLGEKCRIDLDSIESAAFSYITLNTIEEASVVLFFYGKDTDNSQWQSREIEYAKANGKTVIPIIIDEIPKDSWYKAHFDNSLLIKYADEALVEPYPEDRQEVMALMALPFRGIMGGDARFLYRIPETIHHKL